MSGCRAKYLNPLFYLLNVSVHLRPVRQPMKSIRQRSKSVRQTLCVSSPTSKLKLLVENNCQIDNLQFTYNITFLVTDRFANVSVRQRPIRQRIKPIRRRSRSVSQLLYVSSPTSELKLLVENNWRTSRWRYDALAKRPVTKKVTISEFLVIYVTVILE